MVNLFKKTISSVAAAAVVLTTTAGVAKAGNSYGDVPANAWFAPYVTALADANVFDGSKSSFRPAATMNRAEFVKTLVSAANISTENVESAGFSDVSSDAWFAPYVNAAVKAGFIDGPKAEKGNKFFPNNNISRAAAAKIALGAFGINTADYQSPAAPFTDMNGHWGKEFVTAAYNLSIVDGKSATKFAPNDSIVRAAVSKIAAYTVIASADPATHVRFEDGTSAFSVYTADNITEKVKSIVNKTEAAATDEEMNNEDTTADTTADTTTDTTSPVVSDGSLEISLSSDSPKGAVLPQGAEGVLVAKYDFTSNGDDILLNSLSFKRIGLGESTDFDNLALFDKNGRISNVKSTISSSDDTANITIKGGKIINAGETISLSLYASVAGTTVGSRSAFALVSASSIVANATEVVGDFPIEGSTFEISGVTSPSLKIDDSVAFTSTPKLGEEQANIATFQLEHNTNNGGDIYVSSVTLKDSNSNIDNNFENFTLICNSKEIATVSSVSDEYLTFNFSDITVKESQTILCSVKADVIDGATEKTTLVLDVDGDVLARSAKYGYGANIDDKLNGTTLTIGAGSVSIVKTEPTYDEFTKDSKNISLGGFKMSVNAGKDLELKHFAVDTNLTTSGSVVDDSSFVLFDKTAGIRYDLTMSGTIAYHKGEIGISLPNGSTKEFEILFDTLNNASTSDITMNLDFGNDAPCTDNGTGTVLCLQETGNNNIVDDITPSSLSLKSVSYAAASASITKLPLSDKSVVAGASDVVLYDMEVKASKASDLLISNLTFDGNSDFSSTNISNVKLWKKEGTNETLISTKGGSQINSDTKITFDSLSVAVPANEKVRFVVTVDTVKVTTDPSIELAFSDAYIQDSQAKKITPTSDTTVSRSLSLTDAGTLTLSVDNNDTEISNKASYVLGGSDSDFVASYELYSLNEPTKIKDLQLFVTQKISVGDNIADGSGAIVIKAYSGSVLKTCTLTGTTATSGTGFDASGSQAADTNEIANSINLCAAGTASTGSNVVYVKNVDSLSTSISALDIQSFKDSVESVSIYGNDKVTLLATESVSDNNKVLFDAIDHVIGTTTENIYIKVKSRKIGLNEAGAMGDFKFTLDVSDSEGNDSGTPNFSTLTPSAESVSFITTPVQISGIDMVQSGGGVSTVSKLSDDIEQVLGVVAITTPSWVNTDADTGGEIKAKLTNLTLTVEGGLAVSGVTLTKVNGVDTDGEISGNGSGDLAAGTSTITFDSTDFSNLSTDAELDAGTVSYFTVKGKVQLDNGANDSESISIKIKSLDAGSVEYKSNDTNHNDTSITALYLPYTETSGITISE